jgi:hypothetical protein
MLILCVENNKVCNFQYQKECLQEVFVGQIFFFIVNCKIWQPCRGVPDQNPTLCMITHYRNTYNSRFSEEKYRQFLADVDAQFGVHVPFKIAETPIFISEALKTDLVQACRELTEQVMSPEYLSVADAAIPEQFRVAGHSSAPDFLAIDFAICQDPHQPDRLLPQLIEMQGFPSLYGFQHFISGMYRQHFDIAPELTHLFQPEMQADPDTYLETLREIMMAGEQDEHVILMEIEPEKQKTLVDFLCTARYTGMQVVCMSQVKQAGKTLYYEKDGRKIEIRRIYNRVIFDELVQKGLSFNFDYQADLDVSWAGHPNWFFKISKYTLPFLKSRYVPHTAFLHQIDTLPKDLENYVLKPLFSFAGAGVIFDVTEQAIAQIPAAERQHYVLMRKVQYTPLIETPDVPAKAEVRMLLARHRGEIKLLTNLIRLSKGKMMGVDFNKGLTWVGGTVGFFERS